MIKRSEAPSLLLAVQKALRGVLRQHGRQSMLDEVCRALVLADSIDTARMVLFDRSRTEARIIAGATRAECGTASGLTQEAIQNHLCRVLEEAEAIEGVDDVGVCRGCPLQAEPDRLSLVMPIESRGERVGVLEVGAAPQLGDDRASIELLQELARDIGVGLERLHAAREHNATASLLRRFSERVPGFLFQLRRRPDGTSTAPFVTASVVDWVQRTPEELRENGDYLYERIHADDLPAVRQSVLNAYQTFTPWSCEFRMTRDDGRERWVSVNAAPEREAEGNTLWHGHAIDITDRIVSEREIATLNRRVRLATLASGVGIWEYDFGSGLAIWDERMFEIYGISAEDFNGEIDMWESLVHEDDLGLVNAQMVRAIDTGSDFDMEFRIVRPDGVIRHVNSQAIAETDSEGDVLRLVGTHRDITDQKLSELALRESEARFRTLLEKVPAIAVQGYDAGGVIKYWNEASERLYGYTAEEAMGRPLMELIIPEESRSAVAGFIRESARTGVPIEAAELELMRKDGQSVPVYSSHAVVRPPGQPKMLYCIDVDLTEHRQLEAQLRQAQKMESIGLLAGGIAHDFNNLLAAILGNVNLARDGIPDSDEELGGYLREVEEAAERAAALTRQLLVVGRREKIAPRSVDLNALTRRLLELLRGALGERVRLAFEPADGNVTVRVDPGQLEQVLLNLCINARDAMNDGGAIRLATESVVFDEADCRTAPWARPGRFAGIRVTDQGCGMEPNVLRHIFEPFFSTKGVGQGTGLGLSIVYGIVQQNEGLIDIDSEPGRGTTVFVLFPLSDEPAMALDANTTSKLPRQRGGAHILLAEDEDVVLRLTRRILERGGHRVTAVSDGETAMALLEGTADRFDLLLADVVMPKVGGAELAEYVRDRGLDLPVVFMSGYAGGGHEDQRLEKLGAARMPKPFRADALLRCLDDVLNG